MRSWRGVIAIGVLAILGTATSGGATTIALGAADPNIWSVLSLGAPLSIESHSGVFGTVGVGDGGSATDDFKMNKGFVEGVVRLEDSTRTGFAVTFSDDADSYVGPTASSSTGPTLNHSNPNVFQNDASVRQAVLDAISISATYGALSDTGGVACGPCSGGSITTGGTITVTGAGIHVLNLTDIDLNSATLTINAPSNASLIINVAGDLKFANTNVLVTGGMEDKGLLFNVRADAVGSVVDMHSSPNNIHGVILVTDDTDVTVHNGTSPSNTNVYGSVIGGIAGQKFDIISGAFVVPEPSTSLLLGVGLVGLALRAKKIRK